MLRLDAGERAVLEVDLDLVPRVDPERGLAFAFAFFDNGSGDARHGTLADGRKVTSGPAIPWTWQIAEVFKIERGLIGPVESVLHPVPYGMGSGWSTWKDAMSSAPRVP